MALFRSYRLNRMKKTCKCWGKPEVKDDIIEGRLPITVYDHAKFKIHGDGTVTGLGPDTYMIGTLKEALAPNTIESLSTALGLGTSTQRAKETNLLNAFTQLLLGQSQNPLNGIINYETAIILLNEFVETIPETVAALKTISYTMMRLKQQNNEIIEDIQILIHSAIHAFYGAHGIDYESQMTWKNLAPLICEVTQGNAEAATKVVKFLATQSPTFRGLNNMKPEDQLERLETAIQGTVEFLNM